MKGIYRFIILLLFPLSAFSQTWVNYYNQETVNCIAQEDGYIWEGTTCGIVRLDTTLHQYQFFDKINSPLPENNISSIAIDQNGVKWFGTYGGGVVSYDNSTWTIYNAANSIVPSDAISSIVIDGLNNKWIGTDDGLVMFNDTTWQLFNTSNSLLPANGIMTLHYANNKVWVATLGLVSIDGSNWQVFRQGTSFLYSDNVTAITSDHNGLLWVASMGVLQTFDGTSSTTLNTSYYTPPINDVAVDSVNHVWIADAIGVSTYDGVQWTVYNHANSPVDIHSKANDVFFDSQNHIWIGPERGGLLRLNADGWTHFNNYMSDIPGNVMSAVTARNQIWAGTSDALTYFDGVNFFDENLINHGGDNNMIYSIEERSDSTIWIGTHSAALFILDDTTWTHLDTSNSSLKSISVEGIAFDSSGIVWIANLQGGIDRFDGTNWDHYDSSNSALPGTYFYDVVFDRNGMLWTAGLDGIASFDGITWTSYTQTNSNLPVSYLTHITVDANNNIWFTAYPGYGIGMYDGTNFYGYGNSTGGQPYHEANCITADDAGNVWIGTNTGLMLWDGTNFTTFDTKNSDLSCDRVFAIDIDSIGRVWCATNGGGLSVLDYSTIVGVKENIQQANNSIRVSPNPFTEKITLDINVEHSGNYSVQLFDMTGKNIADIFKGVLFKSEQIEFETNHIRAGIYFLKIGDEENINTTRIIKIK